MAIISGKFHPCPLSLHVCIHNSQTVVTRLLRTRLFRRPKGLVSTECLRAYKLRGNNVIVILDPSYRAEKYQEQDSIQRDTHKLSKRASSHSRLHTSCTVELKQPLPSVMTSCFRSILYSTLLNGRLYTCCNCKLSALYLIEISLQSSQPSQQFDDCCYVAAASRHGNFYKCSIRIYKGSMGLFRTLVWTNEITVFGSKHNIMQNSDQTSESAYACKRHLPNIHHHF